MSQPTDEAKNLIDYRALKQRITRLKDGDKLCYLDEYEVRNFCYKLSSFMGHIKIDPEWEVLHEQIVTFKMPEGTTVSKEDLLESFEELRHQEHVSLAFAALVSNTARAMDEHGMALLGGADDKTKAKRDALRQVVGSQREDAMFFKARRTLADEQFDANLITLAIDFGEEDDARDVQKHGFNYRDCAYIKEKARREVADAHQWLKDSMQRFPMFNEKEREM